MINLDDPRLTAYALGELDDAERGEVESALATSPELQAEVESIRQAAALFDTSLQAEAGPTLTEAQRLAIHEQASAGSVELANRTTVAKKIAWRRAFIAFAATGIAVSLLATFLLPAVHTARRASRGVADSTRP
jgi:Ca-activated chloride channel family protein